MGKIIATQTTISLISLLKQKFSKFNVSSLKVYSLDNVYGIGDDGFGVMLFAKESDTDTATFIAP